MKVVSEEAILDRFKGNFGCIESLANHEDRVVVTTIQLDEEQMSIIDFAKELGVPELEKWRYQFTFLKTESDLKRFLDACATAR